MTDLHDMSEAEWDKCWAVNVKGQMALLRAALPQFKKNEEGGSFIMTSSIAVSSVDSSMRHPCSHFCTELTIRRASHQPGPVFRIRSLNQLVSV